MDPLPLKEIAAMAGAEIASGSGDAIVSRVTKDSRTAAAGDLYVALRGERFDGNAFAADAAARGASAVLLDSAEAAAGLPKGFPVLIAGSGQEALTRMAAAWRSRLKLRVLCITGSNGKTSTKEFSAAVLGARYKVARTQGNLNNHIGVPLSILAADSSHTAAVWEIGMNHPGEIAPLAALARPEAAIITNIGVAHIEYMKTRDAIALEKGMLAEAVPSEGFVVMSALDDKTDGIAARCRARVVRTGIQAGEVSGSSIVEGWDSCSFVVNAGGRELPARIPTHGVHMVANALHAIAAGLGFGLTLEQAVSGLAAAKLAGGRLEPRTIRGVSFLDDTYNANPDSMVAALETLRALPGGGHRIAILGRMGELGEHAGTGYRTVGTAAGTHADILVTVGAETAPLAEAAREAGLGRVHEVEDALSAARMLGQLARPGDIVLVKGSRSAQMENVLHNF